MKPHTEIFPPAQKEFWDRLAGSVPGQFILYGGAAVALRFGHRSSIDFDYFTDQSVRYDDLARTIPAVKMARHCRLRHQVHNRLHANVSISENVDRHRKTTVISHYL